MSDETKPQVQDQPKGNDGNPTSTPDVDAIKAARDLLIASGQQVLDQHQFAELKSEKTKEAEAQAAAYRARLEALELDYAADKKRLKEIDDAGKTAQQLREEEKLEFKRQLDEKVRLANEAEKKAKEKEAEVQQIKVDHRLGLLLRGTHDPDLALLAAKHRLPGTVGVDEAGRTTFTDLAGIKYVGPEAEKLIDTWWLKPEQDALRAPRTPAGPPTSVGKPSAPPPEKIPYNPPPGSLEEQIEWAREADRRNAELEGQSR